MSLKEKMWVIRGFFGVSAALIVGGIYLRRYPVMAVGLLTSSAAMAAGIFWWRCPNCGKSFGPPFRHGKTCAQCGLEIDYGARYKKYS